MSSTRAFNLEARQNETPSSSHDGLQLWIGASRTYMFLIRFTRLVTTIKGTKLYHSTLESKVKKKKNKGQKENSGDAF